MRLEAIEYSEKLQSNVISLASSLRPQLENSNPYCHMQILDISTSYQICCRKNYFSKCEVNASIARNPAPFIWLVLIVCLKLQIFFSFLTH